MRLVLWTLLPLVVACERQVGDTDDTGDTDLPDDTAETGDTTDTGDTGDTSDTGDDTDTDTGGDTDTDTDTDTGLLPSRFFNHSPTCAALGALRPSAGEDGEWAAVRLTPPSYPFDLTTVRLTLLHDPDATLSAAKCTSNQAYTLQLYVLAQTAPPMGGGSPTPANEIWTFTPGALIGERVLVGVVDPPITVVAGQHAFLTIDTHYTSADVRTCIKTCTTGTLADTPRNYWSNAVDPDAWAWTELTLSGTGIWAEGEGFPD